MSYSNDPARSRSDVTKNAGAKHATDSMDVAALIKTLKETFDVYYPDKDPLGSVSNKPLPIPRATPELIRWTNTFVEQISYRYSKEVKVRHSSIIPLPLPAWMVLMYVQEAKEENVRLHRELKEVRQRLDVTLSENDKLKGKNHSLHKLNEGLCRHIDELQDEIRELHLEISSSKATIEDLRKKHLSLTKEIEILEHQIAIHKKEQAILISQLEVYQANLAESQNMWLLAVKAQHELELTIRTKSGQLVRTELEKGGLDAKIKMLERQIELSSQNVTVYREAVVEWETRFADKTVEVKKLLEMWASMDKVCKVSVHGKEHWDMHHGFPKGLPGYVTDKDPEPPKKPENGSDPPPKSRGGPSVTPAPVGKKPAAALSVEEGRKDTKH